MKKMRKILSVVLAAVMVFGCTFAFSACAKNENGSFEVVLITDGAPINDKGYNQSAWNGVKAYGDENGVSYRYYQPALNSDGELETDVIANYIELAANDGAKSIVLPGEAFAVAAYEVAPTYQDIQFILIDAFPHSESDNTMRVQQNVMCVSFDNLQAGFLAGYLSVADGLKNAQGEAVREYNTKLGYLGSYYSTSSIQYGSGYVQGAAKAADDNAVPVVLDYAQYDSPVLDYDYSFTIRPVYIPREEAKEDTFKVTVVDGTGSGVYTDGENVTVTADAAPEGKVFDHWEAKSDTEGVKDSKVNISHKKRSTMNLLVGGCDCTITAVWADADTVPVTVTEADGITPYTVFNVQKNSSVWVSAPPAEQGKVFDHWETPSEDAIADIYSKETNVSVTDRAVAMAPVYRDSEIPTFTVTVENGTGSGSYVAGDKITVTADVPEDGYMFYKWENVDSQGISTGIAMENEYNYSTSFEMVDRYSSIVEKMFDDGAQVVFGGGNPLSDSIFTATWNFDYPVFAFGSGIDEGSKGNCFASVVNDYGAAVKLCLENFSGAGFFTGNCANHCIYVTGKSLNKYQLDENGDLKKDKNGENIPDSNYSEAYVNIYNALANNEISLKIIKPGDDVRNAIDSNCLTVNYWVTE